MYRLGKYSSPTEHPSCLQNVCKSVWYNYIYIYVYIIIYIYVHIIHKSYLETYTRVKYWGEMSTTQVGFNKKDKDFRVSCLVNIIPHLVEWGEWRIEWVHLLTIWCKTNKKGNSTCLGCFNTAMNNVHNLGFSRPAVCLVAIYNLLRLCCFPFNCSVLHIWSTLI